ARPARHPPRRLLVSARVLADTSRDPVSGRGLLFSAAPTLVAHNLHWAPRYFLEASGRRCPAVHALPLARGSSGMPQTIWAQVYDEIRHAMGELYRPLPAHCTLVRGVLTSAEADEA